MRELGDYVKSEVKKGVTKTTLSGLSKLVPAVKGVDFGLRVISEGANVLFGDEAKAYEGLGGLMQYDRVLTVSYENYVRMMEDGVATAADMEQADRVFELLRATKAKEYEHMMSLCEGKDEGLFQQYYKKYYQLTGKTYGDHPASYQWTYFDVDGEA